MGLGSVTDPTFGVVKHRAGTVQFFTCNEKQAFFEIINLDIVTFEGGIKVDGVPFLSGVVGVEHLESCGNARSYFLFGQFDDLFVGLLKGPVGVIGSVSPNGVLGCGRSHQRFVIIQFNSRFRPFLRRNVGVLRRCVGVLGGGVSRVRRGAA